MSNFIIKLTNVSKKYILYQEKPTLVESILDRKKKEEFWALKKIHLTINKGERVGIIGPNGSGKTTLLKIISGITFPTTGNVKVNGKIVSIIELEAGFHSELTGEENIYLNGLLIGIEKKELGSKFDEIVSFADIGKFIQSPFYTYSLGMKLRVGFSIATHTDSDTLLLDENMAVGDQEFKVKSLKKINELLRKGKTIIFVSHNLALMSRVCKRIIWLEGGRVVKDGSSKEVIKSYIKYFEDLSK